MLHRGALTRHVRARNQPHVCVRKQLSRGRKISAADVQTATSSHAGLVTECEKLIQLKEAGADQEQIEQQIQHITQLSAAAGTDKIVPELNNGFFRAYTLTGQTAQRFSTVISLGVLSFNKYQPQNIKVKMSAGNDSGGVFKGLKGGVEQAYTVVAYFDFVQQEGEDKEAVPTGLKGRHNAIAEYHTVADNPQRLTIQFNKLQLEPGDKSPEHMQRWLDTLLPHNPDMDPQTGLLTVDMPQHPPEAWLDHLLMIPEYQLLKGSFGSVTLLQRVQE